MNNIHSQVFLENMFYIHLERVKKQKNIVSDKIFYCLFVFASSGNIQTPVKKKQIC